MAVDDDEGVTAHAEIAQERTYALLIWRQCFVVQTFVGRVAGAGVVAFFAEIEAEVDRLGAAE